jgi:hypothetical protein
MSETVEHTKFSAAAQLQILIYSEITDEFLTQYFACSIQDIPEWAAEIGLKLVLEDA